MRCWCRREVKPSVSGCFPNIISMRAREHRCGARPAFSRSVVATQAPSVSRRAFPATLARLLAGLLFTANAWPALAETPFEATDRYLDAELSRQGIPGLALAIVRHGKPVYVRGYGVATLEHPVPVKPDTVFQIGSIGKQFTATAVMLLAREHRLELDDALSKHLPDIPPSWAQVTLRTMLNHQSGIPQLTPPDRDLLDLRHDYGDEEYTRLATSLPLDFAPGSDASYSDTAYVLLGFVVNRVIGAFYGDFLQERVFRPLGMSRTRIISDADIVPDRASGYEQDERGALRNQAWVAPALNRTADGSLYSTVLDLARWDEALYQERILQHGERERMWRIDPHSDGRKPLYHYGFGWEVNRLRGHRVVEYDGNWQGFQAAMARYDDRALTVIVLTNRSGCRVQRLAHTVAGIVDPELAHFRAARDPHPKQTARFRMLLNEAGRSGQLPPELGTTANARLSAGWARGIAREWRAIGPVKEIAYAEEHDVGGVRERVYRVEAERMDDYFIVRYARDGTIDDIDLYREF